MIDHNRNPIAQCCENL